MNVYVVVDDDYTNTWVVGVYDNEAAALAVVALSTHRHTVTHLLQSTAERQIVEVEVQ